MAEAIQRLWPDVQLVYGPPVDNGFYYDMWLPEGERISSDDFERIEKEMKSIIDEKRAFTRYEMSADEGMQRSNPKAASTRSTMPDGRSKPDPIRSPGMPPANRERTGRTFAGAPTFHRRDGSAR